MAISSYTELTTAAANWLARDDLTTRIPEFIALAEAKFNRVLLHPLMERRSTASVDTASDEPEFVSLPSDFQSMRRVRLSGITGKPRLDFMSQTQIEDYRYSIDNVSGQPSFYSIMGSELELAATPNEDYALEMVYRASLSALSITNTTNWLLDLAPDAYLYGTLLEAMPYIGNDERVSLWATGLQTVLDQINTHGNRQSFDAGPSTIWLPGVTP
jgi:hypothetical protein